MNATLIALVVAAGEDCGRTLWGTAWPLLNLVFVADNTVLRAGYVIKKRALFGLTVLVRGQNRGPVWCWAC